MTTGSGPWSRSWLVATLLLGLTAVAYYFFPIHPIELPRDLKSFPLTLGEWHGEDIDPGEHPLRTQGAHEELARRYRDGSGRAVTLYVGYFRSQEQGRELVSYLSKQSHRRSSEVDIQVPAGQVVRVNRLPLTEDGEGRVVFFWYDLNGRIVANRFLAKLATVADALTRGRTNGALVAVSTPEGQAEFLSQLLPLLRSYLGGDRLA